MSDIRSEVSKLAAELADHAREIPEAEISGIYWITRAPRKANFFVSFDRGDDHVDTYVVSVAKVVVPE